MRIPYVLPVRWQGHTRNILFSQEEQLYGETKKLSQSPKLLLEIGQGCYCLFSPVLRRTACETEEREEEKDGSFLMIILK